MAIPPNDRAEEAEWERASESTSQRYRWSLLLAGIGLMLVMWGAFIVMRGSDADLEHLQRRAALLGGGLFVLGWVFMLFAMQVYRFRNGARAASLQPDEPEPPEPLITSIDTTLLAVV